MAFAKKIISGTTLLIDAIKAWATTTFATKSHTHSVLDITDNTSSVGWPNYNARSARAYNTNYTETTNGWILVCFCANNFRANRTLTIYLNGVAYVTNWPTGSNQYIDMNTFMLPIPVGTVWRCAHDSQSGTIFWFPTL